MAFDVLDQILQLEALVAKPCLEFNVIIRHSILSRVAWMSAFAGRSSSLMTAARFATAATYTRMVVTRSASNILCCSDGTTLDMSAVKQSSADCPFSSEPSPQLQSSTVEQSGT
eukprot:489256-Pyramimonas_sp.AAC.1